MWILKLFVLLPLKIPFIQSNDSKFFIKELLHELRDVPQAANKLFLESQLLNGNVSAMDLMGELFDGKLDVKLFEKYREIDLSNGIDEQNQMLELSEKAEEVKVTEEVRKSVGEGFEALESMKEPIPDFEEDLEEMGQGIDNVWNITNKMAALYYYKSEAVRRPLSLVKDVANGVDGILKRFLNEYEKNFVKRDLRNLEKKMAEMKEKIRLGAQYLNDYGIMDELPSIDYLRKYERFINEEKENLEKIRELKDMISKLPLIMNEMKITEELRDSQLVKKIPEMMKELEDDTNSIIELEMSENVASKYRAINSLSGIMEVNSELYSQLRKTQRTSPYLLKTSNQLVSHLNNLHFPSESSFGSFKGLETCLTQHNFTQSADFEKNVEEFENLRGSFETSYEKFRQLVKEFIEIYDLVLYFEKLNFSREFEDLENKDLNEVLKNTVHTVNMTMMNKEAFQGKNGNNRFEDILIDINVLLVTVEYRKFENATADLNSTLYNFGILVDCYSELKVDVPEVKTLIDIPEKVSSMDLRKMENIAEIQYLFHDVDKTIQKLENWKYIRNLYTENVHLTKEEVTAISEGYGVLEAIRNVQDHWDTIVALDISEFENSSAKDGWDSIIVSLKSFTKEISTFKTNSELPELQNFQIDSVVDFIKTGYQGRLRRKILKILEDLRTFQGDYPGYSSKMVKMNKALAKFNYIEKINESVEKFKNWDTQGEPTADSEKEQLVSDCYEDHSDFCFSKLSIL